MKNENFCHLHVHTEYSQLDGMGTVGQYAERAAELGFKYLACTDHGNIDGLIRFQTACEKNNITPILGAELYIVPNLEKSKARGHVNILVKSAAGFTNLCKLLTFGNTQGYYYKPRITYDYLLENCEGLVICTACLLSFVRVFPDGAAYLKKLHKKIGNDLYCEIMPHKLEKQKNLNRKVIRLAKKMGLKVIATMDCHYPNKRDYKAQDVLLAIQRKTTMDDPNRFKFTITDLYLKSANEMRKSFKAIGQYKPEYLTNTIEVAKKCSGFTIPKRDIDLPRVPGVPVNPKKARRFLWDLCEKGYREKTGSPLMSSAKYKRRLKEEYKLIVKKKFERYFFMVWEVINWCKQNNIMVGPGRGSVGGSLMAYLLGITSVDPIKHDLLFSRFINEDRIDYPDIDIDFEHSKRHLVRQHLENVYGEDNVAGVSSFNRMKAKAVMKDVGRAYGVHWSETDTFTKLIDDENDDPIGAAIDNFPECKHYANKHPKVIRFAKRLEGQVRGYGQHAAALVISKEKIANAGRCAIRMQDDTHIVNWEKEDTEFVGLMKLDALGLKLLSILNYCLEMIEKNHGKRINLEAVDLNDRQVLKEIDAGKTTGVFQLGTYAMTALIKEMGIDNFDNLTASVALVRPGPANSGMTAEYIKRKNGAKWEPMHEIYERITKETYGLLVYQEQVMQVISEMAGLPYSMADKIRKIIGKKRDRKEFEKYKKKFLRGCAKTKYFSRSEAIRFWKGLQEWAKYGFNKSHSVEYAMLAYWCSWLKKYYPTEFTCASLTYGAEPKKKEIIEEAYKSGLSSILPKVGVSASHDWLARDGKLFIPFIEVKGIGDKKAIECSSGVQEQKGNIVEFVQKKKRKARIGGKLGELLNMIGAYDPKNPTMTDEIKALFDFRVVVNPKKEYPKLYRLFDNSLRLNHLDPALEGAEDLLRRAKEKTRVVRKVRFKGHKNLGSCDACELIEECKAPVPPSPGTYNIAIVGEAPGPQEDKDRIGFVGKSGDLIWKYLKKRGYVRKQFHVTNIGKCFPKNSRKPSQKQIHICGDQFLAKELNTIKPKIILAFGNTSLEYFYGQKSGIMGLSGKVVWNERFGAWVVYCLHPAATLHNADNKVYFHAGMKRFCKVLNIMGVPKVKR